VRRTVLLTLVSDWLPKLVSFLAVVLVARRLGAPEFAYFAVALSWMGYAWWAVDLGQAGYSVRTLAATSGARQRRLGSEIFSLYLTLAVVVSLLLVALLLVTGAAGSREGTLLLAMSPYLLAYAVFPDWWLRARGQLLHLGAANWAAVLSLLLAWALVPPGDAVAYALAYGLSPFAGAVVAMVALGRAGALPRWVASWTAWGQHLRTSLLFGVAGVGGQVSVPLTLATMTSVGSPRAAGAFALGLRASAAAANALWLLMQNALPRLLAGSRPVTGRMAAAAAVPPLLGVGVAALLWHPLIEPVVGPSYAGAGSYAALGVLLLAVWGPKYVVEIGLVATYGDKQRIAVNWVSPVLVVGAVVWGLADGRSWVMPVVLLTGEGLAAVLGFGLLRGRRAGDRAEGTTAASPAKRASAVGP
jgi:O-antigen/teichoic acid export membrane protein